LIRFVPFFLIQSARGGLDVAGRAMGRTPRVRPGTESFTTRLPAGSARTFFLAVIGLFPGTLTVGVSEDELDVHMIDTRADLVPQLRALEDRVADLFGVPIPPLDEERPTG